MRVFKLKDMVKGWFVGNFDPVVFKTLDVEVAVKKYKKGDSESTHHHRIATEVTVIVSGKVMMSNRIYKEGDILLIEPNVSTNFLALTDVITTVVKVPAASNDKYPG
jgi:quercetin dioxygenase-like cupin family protein